MNHVMLDIETLGLETGSAIVSIGAVRFDAGQLGETFYRSVDIESCQDAGLTLDANTLKWWLSQDDAVVDELAGGDPLADVLEAFSEFYPDGASVWANSPSFDCEMLERAYDAVGLSEPWEFYDERCVRTLRSLPCAVDFEQSGDEHHALDDAKYQAHIVAATLKKLQKQETTP